MRDLHRFANIVLQMDEGFVVENKKELTQVTIEKVKSDAADTWDFIQVGKDDEDIIEDTDKKLVYTTTSTPEQLWADHIDRWNSALDKGEKELPESKDNSDAEKKLKSEAKKLGLSISFNYYWLKRK